MTTTPHEAALEAAAKNVYRNRTRDALNRPIEGVDKKARQDAKAAITAHLAALPKMDEEMLREQLAHILQHDSSGRDNWNATVHIAQSIVNQIRPYLQRPQPDLAALLDSEGMVEKVAAAIWHADDDIQPYSKASETWKDTARKQAKAALQTIKQEAGL